MTSRTQTVHSTATGDATGAPTRATRRLTLRGLVQGIGLRPAVARLAVELGLAGRVGNTSEGVEIVVVGDAADVARFEKELPSRLPAAAVVASLDSRAVEPRGGERFEIDPGREPTGAGLSALVPTDVVVCRECLSEVADDADRRAAYAFTSCTNCGPRYSIIERMPYERRWTSMGRFELCPRCRNEHQSPADRRFHAQTNACPVCGPQVWLRSADDRILARHGEAIAGAAAALQEGRIVALRGLGGYQLLCDAASPDAVERLRQRKRRRGKPLAVLVASLAEAEKLAHLDDTQRRLLTGSAGPIVVAKRRGDTPLAPSVAGGLNTVGLLLPTTPLHFMLARRARRPLVCTSGNVDGEPLAFEHDAAREKLCNVADLWLEHDRPIHRPIDDSVVRVMAGRAATIRLARGLAPLPLPLDIDQPTLATGGRQKAAVAFASGAQAILGPHIGDTSTVAAFQRYVEQADALSELYRAARRRLVCDLHPNYETTCWAERQGVPVMQVQHHHAHIAAGMLEHGWLDRQVLGVAFDGSGFGAEASNGGGSTWGGEFLLTTASGYERVGSLRPYRLPGGEQAIRQPWRVAVSLVHQAAGAETARRLDFRANVAPLLPLVQSARLSPVTTSAGRLFDGVAALVLGVEAVQFEGQAAMLLETACDEQAPGAYAAPIEEGQPKNLDWRPMIRAILRDRRVGVSPGAMAMRFHRGLADAVFSLCRRHASLPVVLGGGVFQNRVLTELLADRFAGVSQPLGLPGVIPVNDGGLAAGQLAIAAALAPQRRRPPCA